MDRARARQLLDYFIRFGPDYTAPTYGWELIREAAALIVLENDELRLYSGLPSETELLESPNA